MVVKMMCVTRLGEYSKIDYSIGYEFPIKTMDTREPPQEFIDRINNIIQDKKLYVLNIIKMDDDNIAVVYDDGYDRQI